MYGARATRSAGRIGRLTQANPTAAVATGTALVLVTPYVMAATIPRRQRGYAAWGGDFKPCLLATNMGFRAPVLPLSAEPIRSRAAARGRSRAGRFQRRNWLFIPGPSVLLSTRAQGRWQGIRWMTAARSRRLGKMRNPANVGQKLSLVGKAIGTDTVERLRAFPVWEQFAQQSGQPIAILDRGGSITRNPPARRRMSAPTQRAMLKGAADRAATSGSRVFRTIPPISSEVQDGMCSFARASRMPLGWRMSGVQEGVCLTGQRSSSGRATSPMFRSRGLSRPFRALKALAHRACGQRRQAVAIRSSSPRQRPRRHANSEFWDKVKIGLDRQIEAAYGAGKKSHGNDLTALHRTGDGRT